MRVLVVESDRQSANHAVRALRDAGHEVVRCHDSDLPAFPCNALVDGRSCPLEAGGGVDVVFDHRAHPYPRPTAFEDGVTCGIRRHVPLVVGGTSALNPFGPWTDSIAAGDDVVASCEQAAAAPVASLAAPALEEVRRRLADTPAVADAADVIVHRRRSRLEATIWLPADAPEFEDQLAVAVAGVLRAHDSYASQVDVAVQRGELPG